MSNATQDTLTSPQVFPIQGTPTAPQVVPTPISLDGLKAAWRDLEEERRCWQAERAEAQRLLQEQAAHLKTRQLEMEAAWEAIVQQRLRAEDEHLVRLRQDVVERSGTERPAEPRSAEQLTGQRLTAERMIAASLAAGPVMANPILKQPDAERPSEPPDLDQPASEGAKSAAQDAAPVNLAETLRRMGLPQPESSDAAPAESAEAIHPSSALGSTASRPASQPDGDEEPIHEYMARLMARVGSARGGSADDTYRPQGDSARPAAQVAATGAPPTPAPSVDPAVKLPERFKTELSAPRTVAPEKKADFSAMRRLANLSAQTALAKHGKKRTIAELRWRLVVAGIAAVTGGALIAIWHWSQHADHATFYAGMVALVVSVYWLVRGGSSLCRVTQKKVESRKSKVES